MELAVWMELMRGERRMASGARRYRDAEGIALVGMVTSLGCRRWRRAGLHGFPWDRGSDG